MKEFLILSKTDILLLKRWFADNRVSKSIVLLSFLGVFIGVFLILLKVSEFFFSMLSQYPIYGELTASYIVHSSVIVLLLFAFSASLFSTLTFLYQGRKQIDLLITLPTSRNAVILWINSKSIFSSSVVFLLIFSPILISLNNVFYGLSAISMLIVLLVVTLTITVFANALGNILAFSSAGIALKYRSILPSAFLLLFSALGIGIFRMIFPPNLARLYYTETPEQFFQLYNNLPLTKPYLPTTWISDYITGQPTFSFAILFGMILIFGYFSVLYQKAYFKRVWQNVHELSGGRKNLKKSLFLNVPFANSKYISLVTKDFLSVVRQPSEAGYAFFLGAMTVLFFFLISVGGRFEFSQGEYRNEVLIFSFVWLLYFYTAFSLRMIFPLMSREGLSRWHIMSNPIRGYSVFVSKALSAIVFSLPFFVISLFVWSSFGLENIFVPVAISCMALLSVGLINILIGSLFPHFGLSEQPEKTTTSSSGIASLVISVAIISMYAVYLNFYFTDEKGALNTLLPLSLITIGLVEGVFFLAKLGKNRYLHERQI